VGGMKSGMSTAVEHEDNPRIINNAIAQQRKRFRACVQREEHFEHLLYLKKQAELVSNFFTKILKIILSCKSTNVMEFL